MTENDEEKCLIIDEKGKSRCVGAGVLIGRHFRDLKKSTETLDIEGTALNTASLLNALGKAEGCGANVKKMSAYTHEIIEYLIVPLGKGKKPEWDLIKKSVNVVEKDLEKKAWE